MYEGQVQVHAALLLFMAWPGLVPQFVSAGLASLIGRLLGSAASVAEDQAPIFPS
ncbi:hypothetical protein J3E69DRAFT_325649 [Trichoderma sp. SZMC 28015]